MDQTNNNRSPDSAISEFLGVVAHRIHTPVSAINWQAEAMLDGMMGELTDEQKVALQGIIQSVESLNDFSRTMLYVYELEKDMPMLKAQEVTLQSILSRVEKSVLPLLEKKRMHVKHDEASRSASIVADPAIAFTILRTFLENAIEYSPDGSEIGVGVKEDSEGALITVEDHGCGISSDHIPSIGTKFFRTAEARQNFTDGAGLDLYIAINLAERTGGKITFDSEEGKGSRFHWYVPSTTKRRQPWE